MMNMNMRSWKEENNRAASSASEDDPTDSSDHSGSTGSSGSSSSMVSFEIALQETTLETWLLDRNSYIDDDNDYETMLIRRKYPWRRFKAFLKSTMLHDTKFVSTSVVVVLMMILVTLALRRSSSRRQRQQQQQQQQPGQSVNFLERHVIEHDYFATDREYVSDYAPISHKCLFGNDNACNCPEEFNPREVSQDWYMVHEANSKMVALNNNNAHHGDDDDDSSQQQQQQQQQHDVIFVGDDLVALWAGNGNMTNTTTTSIPRSTKNDHHNDAVTAQFIHQYFQQTFTKAGGGDVNGLALGIAGDTTFNLRWRLKNGELPPQVQAKIWWLSIGVNDLDLTLAGCSEEATLLGIVRAAQDIMYHKKHADGSVHVVIQALLPLRVSAAAAATASSLFSHTRDKTEIDTNNNKSSRKWPSSWLFHNKNKNLDNDDDDDDSMLLLLLPSIQNINKQLAIFCQQHENLLFFDPSPFLDSISNMTMPKNQVAHLSIEGYQVLGDAIHNEVLRIIRNGK